MPNINFKTGVITDKPTPIFDLDKLLETDNDGSTADGSTADGSTMGKFSKIAKDFPERVQVRLREGTTALLDGEVIHRKFTSRGKMIRSAVKYALSHDDFKEGWDKK